MTLAWDVEFTETVAARNTESVPLSHVSIELGHLYMEEFAGGPERMSRYFERVAPWVHAAARTWADRIPSGTPRISTCFLVDDYFTRFSTPAEVVPMLRKAAEQHGLTIDYLARESGCVEADGVPLARLVESRLVPDPVPGTTGVRPPTSETGWLCNGQRSPQAGSAQAMKMDNRWRPPEQNGKMNHSIFVDIELWDEADGVRRWSCPFLAAVWQLIRLGVLRHRGEAVSTPWAIEEYPDDWGALPAIIKLNQRAAPFSAYRTFSVLGAKFLPIEHAVRTILEQVSIEQQVADQILTRSRAERIDLPKELWERIEYLFAAD